MNTKKLHGPRWQAWFTVAVLCAIALPSALAANGNDDRPAPGANQRAVDEAVNQGALWLIERAKEGIPRYDKDNWRTLDELVLYTLLHADVDPKHPEVVKLLNVVLGRVPNHTYTAAIRAQALQKYDPKLLKDHIRQTAQYLIDTQGKSGFWDYGRTLDLPILSKVTVTPDASKVYSGVKGPVSENPFKISTPGRGSKTTAVVRTPLKRNGWGGEHDNSNSQYALLGLTACIAAGFDLPQDLLDLAEKWFTDQQNEDGGWGYEHRGKGSYGSMTAGGVSSLCIVLRAKGNLQPQKDLRILKALKWLGANLNYATNPHKGGWHYYWIYSVERAGSTAGTEWFGDRPWYKEGAEWLLANRKGDGSWGDNGGKGIADTCWALLFLRRATKSIVTYSSPHEEKKTIAR
jgi:hypothetical protein